MIQTEIKNKVTPEIEEIFNQVYPGVWVSGIPGKAKNVAPTRTELKVGDSPVRIKQYPLKLEDRRGMKEIMDNFLKFVLLIECESEYNTPILLVKKVDGKSHRLVQDLRGINRIVEDVHPVVAKSMYLVNKTK